MLLYFKNSRPVSWLAQMLSARYQCERFDSRASEIGTVSPTTCHRCDVPSQLCCPDVKPRRRAPPLVRRFGVAVIQNSVIQNTVGLMKIWRSVIQNTANLMKICFEFDTSKTVQKVQFP